MMMVSDDGNIDDDIDDDDDDIDDKCASTDTSLVISEPLFK